MVRVGASNSAISASSSETRDLHTIIECPLFSYFSIPFSLLSFWVIGKSHPPPKVKVTLYILLHFRVIHFYLILFYFKNKIRLNYTQTLLYFTNHTFFVFIFKLYPFFFIIIKYTTFYFNFIFFI